MEMNTNTKTVGFSNIESDDVVCVRGQAYYHHSGNQLYRKVIDLAKNLYMHAPNKMTKTRIVSGIIATIDGRFIKLVGTGKGKNNSTFVICEEALIREKVTQSLRNALSFKYSSSTIRKRKRKANIDGERDDQDMIIGRAKEKEKQGKRKKAPVPIANSPGMNSAVGIPTVSACTRQKQKQEQEQSESESMMDGGRIEQALQQSIHDYDQRNMFRSSIHTTTSHYLTDAMNIASHQMSSRSIPQHTDTAIPSLTILSNRSRRQLIACTNRIIREQNQQRTGAHNPADTQDQTVRDEKDNIMSRRQLRTIGSNDLTVNNNNNNNNNNNKKKYQDLDCDNNNNNNCRNICSRNADTPFSFASLSPQNEDRAAAVTNELLLHPVVVAVVKVPPSPHDENYHEEKATLQLQQQQQHEQQQSEDLHPYMSLYPVLRNYNTLSSVSSESSSSTIQQQKYAPCSIKKETAVIEGVVAPAAVYPIAAA